MLFGVTCACCNKKFKKNELIEVRKATGEIILCCDNCKKFFKKIEKH